MGSNILRKYVVLLMFSVFCLSLNGQNIQKYYLFKAQERGGLYHLLPVSLFEDADGEKFSYDLTYTSWNDSITMNFTYIKPEPLIIDSIKYVSGKNEISGKVDKVYVEPKSKKWIHRYSLKSKAENFFQIYDFGVAPEIIVFSKGTNYVYHVKKSEWNKYVPLGNFFFEMMRL